MATLNVKNFPDSLYDLLRKRAAAERRSIAGEVVHLLGRAIEESEPASILELRGLGKGTWQGVEATSYVSEERDTWG